MPFIVEIHSDDADYLYPENPGHQSCFAIALDSDDLPAAKELQEALGYRIVPIRDIGFDRTRRTGSPKGAPTHLAVPDQRVSDLPIGPSSSLLGINQRINARVCQRQRNSRLSPKPWMLSLQVNLDHLNDWIERQARFEGVPTEAFDWASDQVS